MTAALRTQGLTKRFGGLVALNDVSLALERGARALVTNPRLLLLDEPMEGLAPIVVQELSAVLRELASAGTMAILLVEQHAELALELSQRAIVMERGRIVHDGPSAELIADRARLDRWLAVA